MTGPDEALVTALRAGDERAFAALVGRYSPAMLAVARRHVASREIAQDVVQDTWLALLNGLDGFQGRSSLRTWLFRVLVNIAKSRGVRERRTAAGQPDRLPQRWSESPEQQLLADEALQLVHRELALLPQLQRQVVALRDLDGYEAAEVCALLELTAVHQRVLLHRGRTRIRQALSGYFLAA
jgi:RNA polymerase sigma-70 factor (ECF subfamily)